MNRALAALPLALLTTVLLPALYQDPDKTQDPPPDEEEEETVEEVERDIFGRLRTRKVPKDEALQGMWQLLAMEIEGYPTSGLVPDGYLLIGDGFLSFQMHATYDQDELNGLTFADGYQTFMAEYKLDAGEELICQTLIGSWLDEEQDSLEFEDGGSIREYQLERKGKLLTLHWGKGDWMTFGRRLTGARRLKSIYGRDRGEPTDEGPDVFGRRKVKVEGDG
jgi:hypothetical protein